MPCSIITYCYTKVSLALKKRSRTKIGSGSKCRERDEMEIRRKRRTNKMLIAMVTIFVCCWLPLNIVLLTVEYNKQYQYWYYYTLIFFLAHVIAMSSTIYNPFLYAWMNDNFKKEFKTVLPCLFRRDRERPVNGSYTQYTHVDNQPSVVLNRSPQKETDEINDSRRPKAYYDTESEKVQLNVQTETDESAWWEHCNFQKRPVPLGQAMALLILERLAEIESVATCHMENKERSHHVAECHAHQ